MLNQPLLTQLKQWQHRARVEAECIADWWASHTVDHANGGFYGEVSRENRPVAGANKSIIQHSRILWFFSEYALLSGSARYRQLATRAFQYLIEHFDDDKYGAVVWLLDHQGEVVNDKKQTYAISFAIYGLVAYYKLSADELALSKATDYFSLLETHAKDAVHNGYVEAFSGNWQPLADVRLSGEDENFPKTMNTHLHVLEAYTALHAVAPTRQTHQALANLIDIFERHIIDHSSAHLRLFMELDWCERSTVWSYGHDIECSWLMFETLEVLADPERLARLTPLVVRMAETTLAEGIGNKGQVLDRFDCKTQRRHPTSQWWVQAEGLVGFLNGFLLTKSPLLPPVINDIWQFIEDFHRDNEFGEWHYLATCDQSNLPLTYKAGAWKAPYHNGRAMMEISKLVDRIRHQQETTVAQ
ncbi:AGE family epimerase/isomerase [Neiella marina]|uniref:Cellobiose 2-epimerase n=1 Tax=Neiella holothuriorum TaxID=2870530 RepID=A0ABS7EJR7_9GAMM|nr:AGE family epimerase/isomerase [Neiella holothuriorum]MBW8192113.1 AGE family epimerase/isomerase [Neiella holothuriorum]